jgi:hypothetical protein
MVESERERGKEREEGGGRRERESERVTAHTDSSGRVYIRSIAVQTRSWFIEEERLGLRNELNPYGCSFLFAA